MNIAGLFIRRPVMTTLVMLAILVTGIVGFRLLPVSALPNVDFPTIQVTAVLPGANPETMASAVATPLEKQFATIAGLDSMTSQNGQGVTQITLQFALERSIDGAAQDVQAAIAAASRQLPNDMPSPPSFRKVNPAEAPIYYLAFTSRVMPLSRLDEYAETLVSQRLSMVSGVAQVQVFGSQQYAVRVQLDPNRLAATGIALDDVQQAIAGHNVNLPAGNLYGTAQGYTVQATGQLYEADQYRPLVVAWRNGAPVRLSDLGRVNDSVANDKLAAWFNMDRGVILAIQKQPGVNTIEVVNAIKDLVPKLKAQIPAGVEVSVLYDRSLSIRDSVADVEQTLLIALVLVVGVIFLFLRNASATLIPSLALPLSIIGTFGVIYVLGYSLDNLSLLALTLCVGFVVDDAIVVLENIQRHLEMPLDVSAQANVNEENVKPAEAGGRSQNTEGHLEMPLDVSAQANVNEENVKPAEAGGRSQNTEGHLEMPLDVSAQANVSEANVKSRGQPAMKAALDGAGEVGFTIVSMTLSLVAVFIPVLFMGGIVGRLLHEFAMTIVVAVLVSGFVSLSLTPMLASRYLKPPGEARHGRLYAVSERLFDGLRKAYERTLDLALGHRLATLALFLLPLVGSAWLFAAMPKGLLPNEDTGQLFGFMEASQDISFGAMAEHQRAAANIVLNDPNVAGFMSFVGASTFSPAPNVGRLFIRLKPRDERLHADKVLEGLRRKLLEVPGIRPFLQIVQVIQIGGQITKAQYQYTLQDTDLKELYQWAPRVEEKLKGLRGLQDVTSDLQIRNPQVTVAINRDKAAAVGVTPEAIENTLYNAYGSRQVSTIYAPTNQYPVLMEVLPQYQLDPQALSLLYVRSGGGALVPLNAVADLSTTVAPLTVNHVGQLPSVTISFNLGTGTALSDAIREVNAATRDMRLPGGISMTFQGAAQVFQSSLQGMGWLLLAAVLVIYLVLGILYESFIHPLTILSGLPAAGFGALATLLVFGYELNLYGFVGIIMLVGIVKKNAIMMIDFAIAAQQKGKASLDAIRDACLIRFRPIMMTTMAALMGSLPIALGFGAGADARRPLGLAVGGGLLVSQVLTLYITPVIYLYLERLQQRLSRRHTQP